MYIHICWGFPGDSAIKKFPVNEGDARSIPGLRRSPREKKKMATHSSILAWKTPWTEEPGGLYSIGS